MEIPNTEFGNGNRGSGRPSPSLLRTEEAEAAAMLEKRAPVGRNEEGQPEPKLPRA